MSWIYDLEHWLGAGGIGVGVAALLVLVLVAVHLLRRFGRGGAAATVATVAGLVALTAVVAVTLQPAGPDAPDPWRRLILDPVLGASDGYGHTVWRPLLLNVLLFVPLGAAVAARFPGRGWRVWFGLVALSLVIEATQFVLPIGRISNAADVVANGAGAAAGILVDRIVRATTGAPRRLPAQPAPVTARRRL